MLDVLLAGEEGLEPPARGFGDRYSTIEPFPYEQQQLYSKIKFKSNKNSG